MKKDYSKFLPGGIPDKGHQKSELSKLGWQPFFIQQCSIEELEIFSPARITEVHRNQVHIKGQNINQLIATTEKATIGDWVLVDLKNQRIHRRLEPKNIFKRRAPGTNRQIQYIAANVDTVFIVTSCNNDFNVARLERYIAMTFQVGVPPVIVLTKTDRCDCPDQYVDQASQISTDVCVVALNALGQEAASRLSHWCQAGQTVAFLGSSGVGKSTLINSLNGSPSIATQSIREDDSKGRHTTTSRQLYALTNGCLVIDTPGMRELQLLDTQEGIANLFEDVDHLASQCRFKNCRHESEPGCAVLNAIENGVLDEKKFQRWIKLIKEDQFNSLSLAEKRSKEKAFAKMVKNTLKIKK